jgi:hypothetical protein
MWADDDMRKLEGVWKRKENEGILYVVRNF